MKTIVVKTLAAMVALFAVVGLAETAGEEQPYTLDWRYVTGGRIVTKPAVDHGGAIYILSDDRTLYALTPLGRERWRFPVGRKLSAGPLGTLEQVSAILSNSAFLEASEHSAASSAARLA